MVESRFSVFPWVWSSAGVAHHGLAPQVGRRSRCDLCMPGFFTSWSAYVWSVYSQVAAAAAVWLVRGCLGRLLVGLVCVGSVALLPVVAAPNFRVGAGWLCPGLSECGVVWVVKVGWLGS